MKLLETFVLVYTLICHVSRLNTNVLSCSSHVSCTCNESVLSCKFNETTFTFPSNIGLYDHIKAIVIHGDNYSVDIPRKVYDISWSSVERPEIVGNQHNFTLPYAFMKVLPNLKVLRIRNSNLIRIESSAFSNINIIEELDLSNNSFLAITEVESGLENFTANTLKIFNISAIHNAEDMLHFALTEKILYPLSSVNVLDISWIRLFKMEASFELMPNITSLNVTGTFIFGLDSADCLASLTRLNWLETLVLDHWPLLPTNGKIPLSQYNSQVVRRETIPCPSTPYFDNSSGCAIWPPRMKKLYLRYVQGISFYISFENGFCVENNSVEVMSIRRMKIFHPVNAVLGLYKLKVFDMAFLGQHFKTNALLDMPALETFRTPGNNLKEIENIPEFEKIFKGNGKLKVVDLSENELNTLPQNIFIYNTALEEINLSRNLLRYINLNLTQCIKLKYLILSNNRLTTIDDMMLLHLDNLVLDRHRNITVAIAGNDFICSCNNLNFIRWIHFTNVTFVNRSNMSCEDTVSTTKRMRSMMDNQFVQLEETCHAKQTANDALKLSLVGVFSSLTVILLLVVTVCMLRRRKLCFRMECRTSANSSKTDSEQVIGSLQEVRTEETNEQFVLVAKDNSCNFTRKPKYTVFLAYCHEDKHFVIDKLYAPLEKCLREYLPDKNEDTLTLLYDKNFLPGEDIVDICRAAVYQSYVTVAVVSENFLTSRWCSYEMKTAVEFDIPVIPLYLTKCQEEDLSGILRYIYEQKVRLLWPQADIGSEQISGEEMDLIQCLANSVTAYVRHHDSLNAMDEKGM